MPDMSGGGVYSTDTDNHPPSNWASIGGGVTIWNLL